jgi:Lysyl oxidase
MGAAVGLSSTAALAGLIAFGPSANAGDTSGPMLLPDLVVESPDDIVLEQPRDSRRVLLRFSHSTANIGTGPLEIYPDLKTGRCGKKGRRGRVAHQAIYQDANSDGEFGRAIDSGLTEAPVGCMIYHEIHEHYHFEDFARYELYRLGSGKLAEVSKKVSFCVVDSHKYMPQLPGSPGNPYYRFEDCEDAAGTHGISVGWADKYGAGTPGQEFDVTGLGKGSFCLVTRADPNSRLTESATGGEDNNLQTAAIRFNPKQASRHGHEVAVLDEPCAAPKP